jgi:hypothetical protein
MNTPLDGVPGYLRAQGYITTAAAVDDGIAEIGRLREALTRVRNHLVGEFGCYDSQEEIVKRIDAALTYR